MTKCPMSHVLSKKISTIYIVFSILIVIVLIFAGTNVGTSNLVASSIGSEYVQRILFCHGAYDL
jgi:Na+-driven multidrug efflux pump